MNDLDGFVESDIGFDELTEFIMDVAVTSRERADLAVPEAIHLVIDAYRKRGGSDPTADPIRQAISRD